MDRWHEQVLSLARFTGDVVAETLWPTRCVLCDMPGEVLCQRCMRNLSHVDWWRACRRCGAPFGYVQCDACDQGVLARMGRAELPYAACASAVRLDGATGKIVRGFKDQGERRLAPVIAGFMARVLPPDWPYDAITFVPATLAAYRYRGFDHAELIASHLACDLESTCLSVFARPKTKDQRHLNAAERIENMSRGFTIARKLPVSALPPRLILIDDVYTTGATLCAATDALRLAGVREVRCLTFARA